MQHFHNSDFVRDLANQIIRERFANSHGVETLDEYLERIDALQTCHLSANQASRVIGTAGKQRRDAKLTIENGTSIIVNVPMNDPRRPGAKVWAQIELGIWLDLLEMGAINAWRFVGKGNGRTDGQVMTNVPMRSAASTGKTAVVRLIVNAKPGQQARTLDHNPLNLRRSNIYLNGSPNWTDGGKKTAKTDSVALIREQAALRQSCAGKDYGIPASEADQQQRHHQTNGEA
ncbi:hypothetical protein [Paracoccus sp. SCSIO 75233]|uniref:hypothetical protein n=1 Tax=Paracoccus sp. SCSIO 75233 TaxID=3017782 RepID=UPI0022F0219D|nr:hypothetical protein [Paracoccus sp. SCSIO 75233]WBU54631.1 hypothetical protein PAF12_07335 [Paracoccus sp. SCSIO 75233]